MARDDLSGWVEARPLVEGDSISAAKFFAEEIIYRHGIPVKVICDGGSENMGAFARLLEEMGVKKVTTSAYHPQGNGMIERGHRSILDSLSKVCGDNPEQWPNKLPAVLWADRITVKRTTGFSPFYLVYGRHGKLPIHLAEPTWDDWDWREIRTTAELIAARAKQIEFSEENREVSQRRVNKARETSAINKDKRIDVRPEALQFVNGDMVLLHNTELVRQFGSKLKPWWRGPYRVHKEEGDRQWRLKELDGTQLKGTFDQDRLKKFKRRVFSHVEISGRAESLDDNQ